MSPHPMLCTYCKRETIRKTDHNAPWIGLHRTRDHIVPASKGGIKTVVACYTCNHLKRDMMPDEWTAYMAANPSWWEYEPKHGKKRLSYQQKEELAPELLEALRSDPEYIEVPICYSDSYMQLCYEVAMQNPRNWVDHRQPFTKKARATAFRKMTADENARRLREYWKRIALEKLAILSNREQATFGQPNPS